MSDSEKIKKIKELLSEYGGILGGYSRGMNTLQKLGMFMAEVKKVINDDED